MDAQDFLHFKRQGVHALEARTAHVAHLDPETFRGGLRQPKFHSEGMHMPYTNGWKAYGTGFHYQLEAHGLGGKNKDNGFGSPLCAEPFGSEVQQFRKVLLQDAQKDTMLACHTTLGGEP